MQGGCWSRGGELAAPRAAAALHPGQLPGLPICRHPHAGSQVQCLHPCISKRTYHAADLVLAQSSLSSDSSTVQISQLCARANMLYTTTQAVVLFMSQPVSMEGKGPHELIRLSWRACRDQREPAHDNLPAPALPGALMEVDESQPGGGWPEDEMQGLGASTAPSNITAPETEIEGGAAAADAAAHAPPSAAAAEEDGAEVQSHTWVAQCIPRCSLTGFVFAQPGREACDDVWVQAFIHSTVSIHVGSAVLTCLQHCFWLILLWQNPCCTDSQPVACPYCRRIMVVFMAPAPCCGPSL